MIVLDTNVISEMMSPTPSAAVSRWFGTQDIAELFTTAITEAEIFFGLALLPAGRRRGALEAAARILFGNRLSGRVLALDSAAAQQMFQIAARRQLAGKRMNFPDAQIAGIALSRNAAVATRDQHDFVQCGIKLIDPWQF